MKTKELPFVSIVIPVRNEEKFIDKCLNSILANDYSQSKLEILVIDGMSDDGTRAVLEAYTKQYPSVRILDNPRKIIPVALNIGITQAKGEIIMRMDAHSEYEKNYISQCIWAMNEYGADNVGGRWIILPRDNNLLGKTIVIALSHPFGVGNAYYRLSRLTDEKKPFVDEKRWEIHVPYFCCKKEIFEKIGSFNEKLVGSEDIEFYSRLKKERYKTLYVPTIVSYYYMRTNLKEFLRHMYRNGFLVFLPFYYSKYISISLRHLVPLGFVVSLIGTGFLSFFFPVLIWLFWIILGSYLFLNLYFSASIAFQKKDLGYLLMAPLVFGLFHVTYGVGSLISLVWLGISRIFKPPSFDERIKSHPDELSKDEMNYLLEEAKLKGWQVALYDALLSKKIKDYLAVGDERGADWTNLLSLGKKVSVLLLGSQLGNSAVALAKIFQKVYVMDVDPFPLSFLEIRKEQQKIQNIFLTQIKDQLEFPFSPDCFDLIVTNWVSENLLNQVFRVLKNKGHLFLFAENLFNYQSLLKFSLSSDYHSLCGYKKILKRNGFSEIEVYTLLPNDKTPLFYLPLENTQIMNYFFRNTFSLFNMASPETKRKFALQYKLAKIGAKLIPTFHLNGLAKTFSPNFGIIAKKNVAPIK